MNEAAMKILEYEKIKERLVEYAVSDGGKELAAKLQPSIDIVVIEGWLSETTETRRIIDRGSSVPIHGLSGIGKVMSKLDKGGILNPEELSPISSLLEGSLRMKKYMKNVEGVAPRVSSYALSLFELPDLAGEIDRCIRSERVDDRASAELLKIRKKIGIAEERIKSKLESIIKSPSYSSIIQDSLVSTRNGRYVIPVKKEYSKSIEGSVLDTSASGSTLFIEPAGVRKLQEELNLLKIEEDNEVYKILSYLTGMAESYKRELSINIETLTHYDFLFAKAKFSRALEGNEVELNTQNKVHIINAKHPLIGKSAVPLNFSIGETYRALVITGPNTGGKTVVLKTVGLLTLMVQSGLHVPVERGSKFAVFRDILADIGDGQSIEQSLSTFSSHIKNIISIMECSDWSTLAIMDELGAGTDPGEGMGLAVSVLEELHRKGATILATTHYSEIKDFAYRTEGFENGCMEFDIDTLKPAYRLSIGKAGESNAFLIALRLGIDKRIIERAHEITYKEKKTYEQLPPPSYTDKPHSNESSPGISNTVEAHRHKEEAKRLKSIQSTREKQHKLIHQQDFNIGDCVFISAMNRTGIVCELENNKGEVTVMVMKQKFKINKKRLTLYIEGKEMYPENYDFDIVFESKENRKKRHKMSRGHREGVTIELSENGRV